MSLKTRRLLFIFFVSLFFIISALVISYASGYKLTLSKKPLQKTGMFILDSRPRGAKIYLNGKPQQLFFKKYLNREESYITTPAKIKNLLPGEYDIKLELEGFMAWGKKLAVKEGLATFAEDVSLFRKNLPLLLQSGFAQQVMLSPSNRYLAATDKAEIYLFDIINEKKILVTDEKDNLLNDQEIPYYENILWSANENKVIINNLLIDIRTPTEFTNLKNLIQLPYAKIKWGENEAELFFITAAENKNTIYRLNFSTGEQKSIVSSEKIADLLVKDKHLFAVSQTAKLTNLNIYDIASKELLKSIDIPSFSDYEFINPKHNLINLYDRKRQILYLINPFAYFPIEKIINNVKYAYWVKNDKLLYANDFEIWLSDFARREETLLTRLSSQINKIIWHPSDNYIFYATENALFSLELDEREKRNIKELIKLDKISGAFLNEKGDTLYFYAEIGNQKGLYKLVIQ